MTADSRCYVIGLGNIGGAVASRLAATGVRVVGVDLDPAARDRFTTETGAPACSDWVDAQPGTDDRVIVVVRTVEQAMGLLDGLSASEIPLTAFVMTTLDLAAARDLANRVDKALRVIELPVSGGRGGALAGTLTAMAAGPMTDGDRAFLRAHLVKKLVEFGRYGEPTAAKLYNNLLAAYHARAHAEIIVSAARNGLDVDRLTSVINDSSGASWMGSNFEVIVDDLLEKDVALFEASFGPPSAIAVSAGSDLSDTLAAARRHLHRTSAGAAQ
ncbi:MAG TPA: NAD(P)-binding domain-containing protein [Acidimicrobiales bacterium]